MTAAMHTHTGAWTEDEYLALPETPEKIELFDGELVVSPPGNAQHQSMSFLLTHTLVNGATAAGLRVYQDIGVRLTPRRTAIPDVVVTAPFDDRQAIVDVSVVRLVAEMVSPGNAANDRVNKMNHYAAAGIPRYLLVERQPELALRLFSLEAGRYQESASAGVGAVLRLTEPYPVDIDPILLRGPYAVR